MFFVSTSKVEQEFRGSKVGRESLHFNQAECSEESGMLSFVAWGLACSGWGRGVLFSSSWGKSHIVPDRAPKWNPSTFIASRWDLLSKGRSSICSMLSDICHSWHPQLSSPDFSRFCGSTSLGHLSPVLVVLLNGEDLLFALGHAARSMGITLIWLCQFQSRDLMVPLILLLQPDSFWWWMMMMMIWLSGNSRVPPKLVPEANSPRNLRPNRPSKLSSNTWLPVSRVNTAGLWPMSCHVVRYNPNMGMTSLKSPTEANIDINACKDVWPYHLGHLRTAPQIMMTPCFRSQVHPCVQATLPNTRRHHRKWTLWSAQPEGRRCTTQTHQTRLKSVFLNHSDY